MNSFELIPTEENLVQTLKEDLLKRNQNLVYFYNLLLAQEVSSSIAIDGRWGSGKTFFIKQSMLLVNAKNPMSEMDGEKKNAILCSLPFPKSIEEVPDNYNMAVYYDAWENDNDSDPILSLVYEISKQLGLSYDFSTNTDMFKFAGSILEAFTGRNIAGIIDNLKSDNPITKIKEEKDIKENIRNFFSEILNERGNRLVVFVDELDRCKPSYAVQLLERVKHYLYDDRITFVFSVNMSELQHAIKHHYGDTFDACRYLDRFFDMRISLPPADKSAFYRKMGLESSYVLEKVCREVIKKYNMELREILRFYHQVKTAIYLPTHESRKWNFSFSDGQGKWLMITYIVPLLVGLKMMNISLYDDFVGGKNSNPLKEVYINTEVGKWLAERLLNRDEAYEKTEGKQLITFEQKLQKLYDAIFVTKYTNGMYHTMIGDYEFDNSSKDFVVTVESTLSPYADFQI